MRVKGFFGGILMVCGALIILLSGGCSIIFLASTLGQGAWTILPLVAVIGGIPFLLGLALFSGGKRLMKPDDES